MDVKERNWNYFTKHLLNWHLPKLMTEGTSSENIALLPAFVNMCLSAKLNPTLSNITTRDRNSNDRWLWQVHSHLERTIMLHSLNVEIPLTEIYRRINF
ncbi:hypothetical protein IQ276_037800 [Desmonostoc muscorum LEGE 12446]|nr:hypothetical protein [Desmonostoc muscorum LEGE 12446]